MSKRDITEENTLATYDVTTEEKDGAYYVIVNEEEKELDIVLPDNHTKEIFVQSLIDPSETTLQSGIPQETEKSQSDDKKEINISFRQFFDYLSSKYNMDQQDKAVALYLLDRESNNNMSKIVDSRSSENDNTHTM